LIRSGISLFCCEGRGWTIRCGFEKWRVWKERGKGKTSKKNISQKRATPRGKRKFLRVGHATRSKTELEKNGRVMKESTQKDEKHSERCRVRGVLDISTGRKN